MTEKIPNNQTAENKNPHETIYITHTNNWLKHILVNGEEIKLKFQVTQIFPKNQSNKFQAYL